MGKHKQRIIAQQQRRQVTTMVMDEAHATFSSGGGIFLMDTTQVVKPELIDCPFCDKTGCCWCDHSGKIDTQRFGSDAEQVRQMAKQVRGDVAWENR